MLIASGFSWFHLLPMGESPDFFHGHGYILFSAWFVCLVLLGFAAVARGALNRALERDGLDRYQADDQVTVRTFAELVVGGVMGMMGGMLERDDVKRYMGLVGGLALYIFGCNILSIIPGFQPPTDNINTNIGMALIVMVTYMVVGLALDGKGFIQHMMGPVLPLVPLFLVLELISYLAVRPGSLAVRLTGNLFGDHTVFNIMSQLSAELLFYAPVPVIFLALATLVSLIQAGVFSLLTSIYISQSLPHGDHHDH